MVICLVTLYSSSLLSLFAERCGKLMSLAAGGGEEFLLLCPATSIQDAEALANKLRQIVSASVHTDNGSITFSAGRHKCPFTGPFIQRYPRS